MNGWIHIADAYLYISIPPRIPPKISVDNNDQTSMKLKQLFIDEVVYHGGV